jgi:hypothetical protein
VIFRSRALPRFWDRLNELPLEIQRRAEKQYGLFAKNPFHPSLHLKPVGEFWSVRVTDDYRALAVRDGDDFVWVWIGSHDEYETQIRK